MLAAPRTVSEFWRRNTEVFGHRNFKTHNGKGFDKKNRESRRTRVPERKCF